MTHVTSLLERSTGGQGPISTRGLFAPKGPLNSPGFLHQSCPAHRQGVSIDALALAEGLTGDFASLWTNENFTRDASVEFGRALRFKATQGTGT